MPFRRSILVLACLACSSNPQPAAQNPTVRFVTTAAVPNFMDVPFPSDVYLQNGHIGNIPGLDAVLTQNSDMLEHALSVHDGFGRSTFSEIYVDDPSAPLNDDGSPGAAQVDPTSLPGSEDACTKDDSSVYLIDLATKTRLPCRARYHVSPTGHARPTLAIGPARGLVLDGGKQYAAIVTTRVKDKSGKNLAASADFTKIATGDRSAPGAAIYGPAYDTALSALSLGTDSIVGMSVFTTNKMEEELYTLRDELEAAPAPTLAWDATSMSPMGAAKFTSVSPLPTGFTASLDDWLGVSSAPKLPDGTDDPDALLPVRAHDAIATIGSAVFEAINYLNVRPTGYVDPDHANFARDANGKIIPAPEQPTSKIWVTLFVPKTAMPASGYPIVIVQHGLSGARSNEPFELANTFCKNGWMVAAIDSVTFGARAPEPQYQVDQHSVWASAPGAKFDGPDGLADPSNGSFNGSGDLFGNLLNIGALRDQLRQSEIDTSQLVKVLRSSPDLSPLDTGAGAPKIDAAHVAYVGDSLGGIEGAVAAAIEPNLLAWTLNVAGGGVAQELAARSPVIGASLNAGALNFGDAGDQLTDSHLIVMLFQTIAEPGDPLLFASRLVTAPHTLAGTATKPRNILQIEVLYDELVTNESDEALARAAGFSLAGPNVGSNAENGDLANPASNPWAIPFATVNADATGIHDTPVQGTTAVVIQASPGVHGSDLVQSKGTRSFKAPWASYDSLQPFPKLDQNYEVSCPYRELQTAITGFFSSAFAGQTPTVAGFKPPVRDLDDDGTPDATDPDPNDPNVH
ncbi:MAG TPA: hypothetical protein VGH28_32670 [Polyangiaceae bacterium]